MSLTGSASMTNELQGSVESGGEVRGKMNSLDEIHGSVESGGEVRGKMSVLKTLRGYSAYEVAVINGFSGTEEEWLASLKGDPFTYEDLTEEQIEEMTEEVASKVDTSLIEYAKEAGEAAEQAKQSAQEAQEAVESAKDVAEDAEAAKDAREGAEAAKKAAEEARDQAQAIAGGDFLPLAGGKMTGAIKLHGNPTEDLHAVPKQYVDDTLGYVEGELIEVNGGSSSEDPDTGNDTGGSGGTSYRIGHGLKVDGSTLMVDSVSNFDGDNTLPATASLVQSTVGNIEVLLATI